MIKVAIADDHPIVRRGITQIISMEVDMEIACEAGSAQELLERLTQQRCDVLIVDVALPDQNGLELLQKVRERLPGLPVIVLSVYPPAQFAARAIRGGAAAYLTKESATEELILAIRAVVRGERFLTPATAEALALAIQSDEPSLSQLSPRERQVLELYASGKTVTEIADATQLSVRTVSTYKSRMLEKLGLSSNAELIAFAIRHGLTTAGGSPDSRQV